MIRLVLSKLNVKEDEESKVLLMLGTGFFLGSFLASYQVVADSLFLSRLSGELNKAFLVAGLLGIVSTALFSWAQNHIRFSVLTSLSIILIVLFTVGIYSAYRFGPSEYQNFIVFGMYCMSGPMTAVLLLCYWGIFGRLFDFKQSKRIIGWIDTGQLVASIIAYFLIPLTARFFGDTSNFLLMSAGSISVSATLILVISLRFTLTRNNPSEVDSSVRTETSLKNMLKDHYVVLLSSFLVISMTTYIFTQFAFQSLINVQYPNPGDMTNFMGYFYGAIYLLSLVMQAYINDKIISNYGVRVSLFVLPAVIIIFSVGALISGAFFGTSPITSPSTFVFFFLFVALTRLFNWMLRDALENPVYKLLFIPLDNRLRFGIQSKVEGVINESGRFAAGLMIFVFSLSSLFEVIWMPALLILLAIAYFVLVRKLHIGYRNKIREKLETKDSTQEKLEIGYGAIIRKLEGMLQHVDTSKAVFSFRLLEKLNPAQVGNWVNSLMKNESEDTREYAQRRMNEIKGLSVSERYVVRIDRDHAQIASKNILSKSDLELVFRSGGDVTKSRISRLSRSTVSEDRQYAAELLLHSSADENVSMLIDLLNDPDAKVRNTAIKTSIKRFNDEVIYALIDNLNNPQFSNQAMNALVLIGGRALQHLENAFYRTGQSTQTLIRIVRILGRIGGQRAKDLLWGKIDYHDKVVVSQVLLSLGECGFKAGISQITRIKYAIESDVADISWNLNAIQEIGSAGRAGDLKEALRYENQNDIEHIYMLLAMLYDTRSIQLVKENIESGTTEGSTYAVELLDVFLSEQLKQRVIPVLDDLTDAEKINRLEVLYPRIRLDEKLILKFLLNRDLTQSNRWSKACVLHQIGFLRVAEFKLDLIAQLFNPDPLIQEVAAWALFQIEPEWYHENVLRLSEENQDALNEVIRSGKSSKLMRFEVIRFFSSSRVFTGIPGITLSFLADIAEEVRIAQQQTLVLDEQMNQNFYMLYEGSAAYYAKGSFKGNFERGDFIGEMLSAPGHANLHMIMASDDVILLKINKEQYYELLSDNVKLAERILEYL
ncbi:MAG: hypothetical protein U0V64_06480 [Cyclobacteriaceae bacterium]